jgi:hypothetical protein
MRSLRNSLIGLIINLHDHSVHIVGLENLDPFASERSWDLSKALETKAVSTFKKELNHQLTWWPLHTWPEEDRDRVRSKVTFQSLRGYLRIGDWGEEFSWQLVGRWLNALAARRSGKMKTPVIRLTKAEKAAAKKARRKRKRKDETETESESEWDSEVDGWGSDEEGVEGEESEEGVKMEESESEEEDY